MTRPARFWPLATIIILPVLVLAGVAAYGLKVVVERQRVQEQDQLEHLVLPAAAEKMQAALDALWAATSPVLPFSDPPAPRVAEAGAQEWERLAAQTEAAEVKLLPEAVVWPVLEPAIRAPRWSGTGAFPKGIRHAPSHGQPPRPGHQPRAIPGRSLGIQRLAHHAHTVDNFIATLRARIEPDPEHPQFIETVRGTGYRLHPAPALACRAPVSNLSPNSD